MKTYNYKITNPSKQEVSTIINFDLFKEEKNILIQVFCGQDNLSLQKTVNLLSTYLPKAFCIGTTTDGEICEDEVNTNSIIISISIFKHTIIKASYSKEKDSFQRGSTLAKDLITENTKVLILFTDTINTNGETFLKGIESVNKDVLVSGAMAGDNAKFKDTYVSCGNKVFNNAAVGISLNSNTLLVQNDLRFNWSSIGINHTITKVIDNRVYEINNLKTIDFYKKYLGEEIVNTILLDAIAFPLLIKRDHTYIARAAMKLFKDGSIQFTGNIKEGDKVKFGFGNAEMILKNPIIPFEKDYSNVESFFIYSCMARRRYVGELINTENKAYANITNTSGFFSYGEFYKKNGKNELYNQTFTLLALNETMTKKVPNQEVKKIDNQKTSKFTKTIQTLTHLIEQSSKDYDEQSKHLENEKINSQILLASQKIFLRHAVHETNTPISVIMSNIELYEMDYGKNKYLSTIEVALKNIFNIYDDLSYLVKKDQVNYPKRDIDFVDYIRSRIDFFNVSAQHFGSNIIFASNIKTLIFNFNETKLQRIIDNNLTNAIKYTDENTNIYLVLKEENNCHILTISSSSEYIQYPEKIFKEYYREESTKEGFGLGLSLVKRICDEENIGIKIDSNEYYTSFSYIFKMEVK